MQPSWLKFNIYCKVHQFFFQIIQFDIISRNQATISNHPNVFTFIIPLSEGRAGEAWQPNKIMLPPSPQWIIFYFPLFTFIYSSAIVSTSLTLAHRSPRFWAGTDNSFVHKHCMRTQTSSHQLLMLQIETVSGPLTRPISRKHFIVYCRHESLKSYKYIYIIFIWNFLCIVHWTK
jgi:hypothetical protein